ncbi:restriction endonuclease subunit S [Streptomyces sp. NBC_01761]|uniref:restriction endonuclease subunit S n=1 Tax=Streptomyces sp. NBC_01761 TaxID=2975932 RepID=UPI002DD913F3|nr:restriction endonuclease subunit S [Streptomyces sp. NBC_01761]WSC56123.1 restriction endonuclease subunit S [Streptomyces sp. NBC_01761]
MSELPPGWMLSRVGDAFDMQLGKMLSKEASSGGEQRCYLTNKNVQWNRLDFDAINFMSFDSAEREKFRLVRGDLLVTEGGEVGRTAMWEEERSECYFQKSLHRLRSRGQIDPRFMLHYMHYAARRRMFTDSVGQTSIAHLPQDKFAKHLIMHPVDLAVQRRIVAAIDSVGEVERGIEASIAKLRSVRQGVLLDFMEKIAPEWKPVKEVGEVRMGKQLSPDSRAAGEQYPYLRVANVYAGHIDYSNVNYMSYSKAERKAYGLVPGDILLNEGQSLELVGRSAIYRKAPGAFFFQNTLIRFRCSEQVMPEYAQIVFEYWLRAGVFAAIAKQTTSIAHLGGGRFGALNFPLVSLSGQQTLVASVASCDESLRTEADQLAKLRLLKRGLVDDLLTGRVAVSAVGG